MKKAIFAIATLAVLSVGNSFAQRGYSSKGHNTPAISNARFDNPIENYSVNKLDDIVKLSNKQEKEIKKIENKFDGFTNNTRRSQSLSNLKRLESQKQQEILAVLTSAQRQSLMIYQNAEKFDNRGKFGNNSKYNRKG